MVNFPGLRQKLCLTKKQKRFWKACLPEMYRPFPVWQKIRMKISIMIRISSRDWKSWLLPFRIRNIRPSFWQRARLPISLRRFGMLMKQYILSCPLLLICRSAMGQARHSMFQRHFHRILQQALLIVQMFQNSQVTAILKQLQITAV